METFIGYALAALIFIVLALPAWFGHRADRRIDAQLRAAERPPRPTNGARPGSAAEAFGQPVAHGYRHTPRPI